VKGLFVVLEGLDAGGKSTQLGLVSRALRERGIPVVTTREPGGTPLGEALRKLLLEPGRSMRPLTELLLMVADRHEHVEEVIRPTLRKGFWILCSRYVLSSLSYQGYGRNLPLSLVRQLNELATSGLAPDYTFLLDVAPKTAYARASERGAGPSWDRLEEEGENFLARVRAAYLELIREVPGEAHVIPAELPPEQVCREILAHLPLPG
jgi:dTMP kinase